MTHEPFNSDCPCPECSAWQDRIELILQRRLPSPYRPVFFQNIDELLEKLGDMKGNLI